MDLSLSFSFRTFSLPCSDGVCRSEGLPSCTKPMEWEEPAVISTHQCQETLFNNNTLFCGKHGTKEVRRRGNIGGGVVKEVTVIPCMDCDDLLTWTAWGPCTDQRETMSGMKCRQRGNDMLGFEVEKKKCDFFDHFNLRFIHC